MRFFRRTAVVLMAACISSLFPLPAASAKPRELPKQFRKSPYSLMSLSVGHPNDGWQVRAKKLKKAPGLSILKKAKSNVYGHPALVLMLKRSAKQLARQYPGSTMVVGDLSDKDGGSLVGHKSHQSGRDADILFYAMNSKGKKVKLDKFVAFDGNGKARDGSGLLFDDERNWTLLVLWAKDDRAGLSHIFVSTALRARLLAYGQKHPTQKKYVNDVAALLKQPARSGDHADHFHVRISCPKRQEGLCFEQSK